MYQYNFKSLTMSELRPLAIAIMGPTASGKTDTALAIARRYPCEIISVDSALVYRGMDIGTAKPTLSERKEVIHHLIDIIDPTDAYSAAQFYQDATRLVMEITQRGKIALLVGGTMLYFKALADGLNDMPSADPEIRKAIENRAKSIGWPALHKELSQKDPITGARLKPNDSQRIERALEIIELTGKTVTQLQSEPKKHDLPFDILWISLEPSLRANLHERIARRFDIMLKNQALIDELKLLKQTLPLHLDLPSMRCVGYRQCWQYLDGVYDLIQLREKGIAATRQLAKRQLTWLRSMPNRHIVDCLSPNVVEQVLAIVEEAFDRQKIKISNL